MGPDKIPSIPGTLFCRALEVQPFLVDASLVMQRLPATSVTTSCWYCNARFSDFTVASEHLIRNHFCNGCCRFHQNHEDIVHHSEVFDFFKPPYPCTWCLLEFDTVSELQTHSANHFLRRVEKCSYDMLCPFYTNIPAIMQHHTWLHKLNDAEQRALHRRLASKEMRAKSAQKFIFQHTKTEENVPNERHQSHPLKSTAIQEPNPESSIRGQSEETKVVEPMDVGAST